MKPKKVKIILASLVQVLGLGLGLLFPQADAREQSLFSFLPLPRSAIVGVNWDAKLLSQEYSAAFGDPMEIDLDHVETIYAKMMSSKSSSSWPKVSYYENLLVMYGFSTFLFPVPAFKLGEGESFLRENPTIAKQMADFCSRYHSTWDQVGCASYNTYSYLESHNVNSHCRTYNALFQAVLKEMPSRTYAQNIYLSWHDEGKWEGHVVTRVTIFTNTGKQFTYAIDAANLPLVFHPASDTTKIYGPKVGSLASLEMKP